MDLISAAVLACIIHLYYALSLQALAGRNRTPHAWLAWLPVANLYLTCRVAGKPGWWTFLLVVPGLNVVVWLVLWGRIAASRGQPRLLALLWLVPIVNLIVPGYLAFFEKLQRYVLKDTLKALVPAFATLVLIMMAGFCMQLLHEGLDVVRLRRLLPPLLAYCVPMVLPAAVLTAVVMTFGRLSADNELVAVRAAGIPLLTIVLPVLLSAVILTGVTAFFQFELVPRSRAAIERLKYDAFQQILLDKVVLSARRQFAFDPVFIQYDDFVGGRLTNLLLLKMGGRYPDMLITAASAVIRSDQEQPDVVSFEMEDCIVTRFGQQTYTEAGTTRAKKVIYSFGMARDRAEIATDEKHLPTAQLLSRKAMLEDRIARQTLYDYPSRVRKEKRRELRIKNAEVSDVNQTLARLREKYSKYAVEERRQYEDVIASNRERIGEAEHQLEILRPQLLESVQRISEARDAEAARTDYDRLVELENRGKALREQIETREAEIQKLEAEIQQAEASLEEASQRAAQIQRQIDVLEAQKQSLLDEREALRRQASWADDQHDLISVRLRIHKRLAQAVSLLVFALLGIPLGIMAGGRSTMIAFGISFAIVLLVFYPFLIFGQIAAKAGTVPVVPAMWAGNVFVCVIGAALMSRVLLR